MIINMLLSWYRGRDLAQQGSKTQPLQDKDILHDVVAHDEEVKTRSKPLTFLANHLHLSTFLPLAIITILQDVDLGLAGLVCVAEIILCMLLGFVLYRTGYIKVFPKKFDIFNLQVSRAAPAATAACRSWVACRQQPLCLCKHQVARISRCYGCAAEDATATGFILFGLLWCRYHKSEQCSGWCQLCLRAGVVDSACRLAFPKFPAGCCSFSHIDEGGFALLLALSSLHAN
jgi:hypothetical protein